MKLIIDNNGIEKWVPHGKGLCTWVNGVWYEGQWKEGIKHGEGSILHANKD